MSINEMVIYPALFLAVFLLIVAFPHQFFVAKYQEYSRQRQAEFETMLKELFVANMTPAELFLYYLGTIIGSVVVVYLLTNSFVTTLIFGVLAYYLPVIVFAYLKQQRIAAFNEQLPASLDQLASAAKAGLTLVQAFEEVAKHAQPPLSEEFGQIVQDQRLGTDLSTALMAARERVKTVSFNLTVTALLVNISQGGNLPEATETISKSLKEIWRLEQKLLTASSEGRKGAVIICVMPLVIFLMVSMAQPELIDILVGSLAGFFVMLLAAMFYAGGIWWLVKILRFDV